MAIKVTLRQKLISKGRNSLYLDFYPPIKLTGSDKETRREFLNLSILIDKKEFQKEVKEQEQKDLLKNNTLSKATKAKKEVLKTLKPLTAIEKSQNKQTLLLAEQIKQKRHNELNKPEVYTKFERERLKQEAIGEKSFIDYYKEIMDKRTGKNYAVWLTSLYYLEDYTKGVCKFSDLNLKYCNDYKDYLLSAKSKRSSKTNISQNTALSYFNKFKATLKQAFKDELLTNDLNSKVKPIEQADTNRVFLTKDELNKLANTHCPTPLLKEASLFSVLTGLRFSDIAKMKWSEIIYDKAQGYFIQFQQQKTKSKEYLPIPEQAYSLLGEPKEPNKKVFEKLKYSAHLNKELKKWAKEAKITKEITFHSFRHTYATLQLQEGTDIYTVSKMLGHKDLKTTQIYAKIVDESKREATNKINIKFN